MTTRQYINVVQVLMIFALAGVVILAIGVYDIYELAKFKLMGMK